MKVYSAGLGKVGVVAVLLQLGGEPTSFVRASALTVHDAMLVGGPPNLPASDRKERKRGKTSYYADSLMKLHFTKRTGSIKGFSRTLTQK